MTRTNVTRTIDAPVELVFKTIADINEFSKAIPDIVKVEFLSDAKSGVGTRFRETRIMKGKEAATELEVTEYEDNQRIRIVADTGGTIWDSVFTVAENNGGTELTLVMEARPHTLIAKLTTPLISGMVKKAIENDMNAVKNFCENQD